MRSAGLLVGVLVSACAAPAPVKSASGEAIAAVTIEERFALDKEVREASLRGDRLRDAVPLMDRHGVLGMSGAFVGEGVLDQSTLVLTVRPAAGPARQIVVRNCAEPKVCAFFAEAAGKGLVDHRPLACRGDTPCARR